MSCASDFYPGYLLLRHMLQTFVGFPSNNFLKFRLPDGHGDPSEANMGLDSHRNGCNRSTITFRCIANAFNRSIASTTPVTPVKSGRTTTGRRQFVNGNDKRSGRSLSATSHQHSYLRSTARHEHKYPHRWLLTGCRQSTKLRSWRCCANSTTWIPYVRSVSNAFA